MLINIQALRALAAMLVVVVHLEVMASQLGIMKADVELFAAGVDLFFVISGFIMVYTTSAAPPTPVEFFVNRLVRIAPLYWLMTLAVFLTAAMAPALMGGTDADPIYLIKSLLFLPFARDDGLFRPILFVGWSLNYEMFFYVLFAGTLMIAGLRRRVALTVAILLFLVLLGSFGRPYLAPALIYLAQPVILEFALGMLIGLVYANLPASARAARIAALGAPLALALLLLCPRWLPGAAWPVSGLPAAALVIAALIAERGGLRLDRPGIVLLGNASYALYLTHPIVTQGITKIAQKLHLLSAATALPLMLFALVGAALAGIATHLWVERPLGRFARRLFKGPIHREPVSAVAP